MRRTLKLTISYDGTRFVGWQRQADGVSVQGLLEDALARFEGDAVDVQGAGRTDAGVHALGQVASARMTSRHTTEALARGLNACLPPDVRVTRVEDAAPDFHARFSARSKTYRYLLRNAHLVSPFERAYVGHVPEPLDLLAMRAAADTLVGTHDFSAFRSTGSDVGDATRTVTQSEVHHVAGSLVPFVPTGGDHTLVAYEVSANGFLRHMVRAIVGTLVDIGRGRRAAASMAALLAGGSRAAAGATAAAHGLFLVRVDYD
ncbi:MAG: tRNA pseudouridine(38-40) synthase TruA [Vicinamibacterales bacterium]